MGDAALLILLHQLLFQGMFFIKNIALRRKLGKPIRGANAEATLSIGFFVLFIGISLYFAWSGSDVGSVHVLSDQTAMVLGVLLMLANLIVGLASLKDLGDSWRVGVIEEQRTTLVEEGIYRFTRNPYFVAYLLLFAAYTVLLQNTVLLVLSCIGCGMIHAMILREEKYLAMSHGSAYQAYRARVPRYLLL